MSYRHSSHHKSYANTRDGERGPQPDRNFQQHSRKDDDTNYDHVTMDMSEESNNNNSDNDSPRGDVRRRCSQSSGERDCYRGTESSPDDRGRPKSREPYFDNNRDDCGYSRQSGDNLKSKYYENIEFSTKEHPNDHYNSAKSSREKSNERQTYDEYRDQPKKLNSSDKSYVDDSQSRVSSGNDDSGKYSSPKGSDKETSRRYDQDNSDRKDREKKDRDSDRNHRYDADRNRHNTYYKDKFDKKYSNDKRSTNDDRRKDRSRSRDRSSGGSYKRRSHSGDRERNRSYYHRSEGSGRSDSRERRSFKRSRSRDRSPASNFEYKPSYKVSKKLQALDKMGLQIKTPDGSMATAEMLLKQTFAQQVEKVKNDTGIELPKYYNPAAMNPLKYANQIQKRKLLWGNKGKEAEATCTSERTVNESNKPSACNKWQDTKFAQDTDGKVASKFMRLMGIKDPSAVQGSSSSSSGDIVKKQEEMFEAMQAQYEVARATTHTMRGVGLGFSSHAKPF